MSANEYSTAVSTARTQVSTRVLTGFDDPTFGPKQWEELLANSNSDLVYLTWHWQRAWWETFGKGQLLLIAAEEDGRVIALAPFYARSGMVYFVGNAYWEADRLDFIGDIGAPGVLDAILATARDEVAEFEGFRLEFVPGESPTGELLKSTANRLNLSCYEEWDEVGSALDLIEKPEVASAAVSGKKIRKREMFFRARGALTVQHLKDGEAILSHLEEFFTQHAARWAARNIQSSFQKDAYKNFYERLTRLAAATGWLRFTRLDWDGRPIAFHYGFSYRGRYFWNNSSFAIELGDRSPGQVMLRQLLLAALEERARIFDFGTGDQAFKLVRASDRNRVQGWGLFPASNGRHNSDASLTTPTINEQVDLSCSGNDHNLEIVSSSAATGQRVVELASTTSSSSVRSAKSAVTTRIIDGFYDPAFGCEEWERLLHQGGTDSVFLTWHFQRAWWETLGRGELLLIAAERDGQVVALAPFYTECHMVYFLGTGFESDCLDFIGDVRDPEVLCALLDTARSHTPEFEGFKFYFIPDKSGTGTGLAKAAERLDLSCYEEGDETAPWLDMAGHPGLASELADKKKLLKYERFFRETGQLKVQHFKNGEDMLPYLDELFEQHIARRPGPTNPSRFLYPKARMLVRRLTQVAAHTGWLRFTRLEWEGRSMALHHGFHYRGRYIWGSASFALDLAKRSPGLVLIRQLLLAAIEEGATAFDFRTGDAPFKLRFASEANSLHHWGLYRR
jgi:CelD/BcsL family acetyltransferase involved in cellulose biosynthesis